MAKIRIFLPIWRKTALSAMLFEIFSIGDTLCKVWNDGKMGSIFFKNKLGNLYFLQAMLTFNNAKIKNRNVFYEYA